MTQTLYGFERTICACDECVEKCRHMSGLVAPEDLRRWHRHFGGDITPWAMTHLVASPGAIVAWQGETFRIPTIVPARDYPTGRCHWLMPDEACAMHAIAPFGCGWFDHAQSREEGDHRSFRAHVDILYDFLTGGPYSRLWKQLHAEGKVVEGPEVARLRLRIP